jgi:flagellar basal-body rod protein FlgG
MLAELARQDQIAHDLANAATPGYKPDRLAQRSFGDLLLTRGGTPIGSLSLGVGIAEARTDMTPSPLRETGDPLDVGLVGEGFLSVRTPAGVAYTRDGQLSVDSAGHLVTSAGFPLLDRDGSPIAVASAGDVQIASDGTVTSAGKTAGRLAVVSLTGAQRLGDGLYAGTAGETPVGGALRQGQLEASGVNAASAMVEMMVSLRAFEANQRVVRAIDETLGRGINGLGGQGGS